MTLARKCPHSACVSLWRVGPCAVPSATFSNLRERGDVRGRDDFRKGCLEKEMTLESDDFRKI